MKLMISMWVKNASVDKRIRVTIEEDTLIAIAEAKIKKDYGKDIKVSEIGIEIHDI